MSDPEFPLPALSGRMDQGTVYQRLVRCVLNCLNAIEARMSQCVSSKVHGRCEVYVIDPCRAQNELIRQ